MQRLLTWFVLGWCGIALAAGLTRAARAEQVFVVNSTGDAPDVLPGDGRCEIDFGSEVCALRAAVNEANALPGADRVTLPAGEYVLATALGELAISDGVTINGVGPAHSVVRGGAGFATRLITIAPAVEARLAGLTLEGGHASGDSGGAIENRGTLTIETSILQFNRATRTATLTGGDGGAIANHGTLTISASLLRGNQADDDGGAIINYGVLTVVNTTLSNNRAGLQSSDGDGGAIATLSPTSGSTARLTAIATTIADNQTATNGGGIRTGSTAVTHLRMTLLARNQAASSPNCSGAVVSEGHNLDDGRSCRLSGVGDISGFDARLAPLGDYGGPTPSYALLDRSPALDRGATDGCPATDQRGVARPLDGDADGMAVCDIGAVERDPEQTLRLPVWLPLVQR